MFFRNKMCSIRAFALFLAGVLPLRPAAAQTVPAYTFVDLGTTTGLYTTATSINNAGQITGVSNNGANNQVYRITPLDTNADGVPDTWFQGSGIINTLMQVLSTDTRHPYSEGWGINAKGEIAGQALGSGYTTPQNAFFWNASGAGQQLTSTHSWSWGINDRSSVIGDIFPQNSSAVPTLWRLVSGKFSATTIPPPTGSTEGRGQALNNLDQVVGYMRPNGGNQQAYVWLPSAAYGLSAGTSLLSSPTGGGSFAMAINDAGVVGGNAFAASSNGRACLWVLAPSAGLVAGFGYIDSTDWSQSSVYGLNSPTGANPLIAVGYGQNALAQTRAVVWDSQSQLLRDLNALTVNAPQGGLSEAHGVNVGGLIVGYYTLTTRDGNKTPTRAFLLLPNTALPFAGQPPLAPANLSPGAPANSQIQLNWTDMSGDENGFQISRATDGTNFTQLGWVGPNTTTFTDLFTDIAFAQGMRYDYRVRSFNAAGYSDSAMASVITPGVPLAPGGLTTGVGSSPPRISLRWQNNSNTQDAVCIERGTDGQNFVQIASVGGTETSYMDYAVQRSTTYYYRVRSHNADGYSNYYNTASATTYNK